MSAAETATDTLLFHPSKELYLKVIHMSGTTLGEARAPIVFFSHFFPHTTPNRVAVTGVTETQTQRQSINNNDMMHSLHTPNYLKP